MVDPNTRQGKRTPVTLKIKFKSETLEQFIERYAVDVSQGGIFIRTKEPLAVGTQMKFEFQLRDASPLIAGEGTVVWTRENDPSRPAIAPGMGVRFDRLADGSQVILERILTEKAKQAPQRPTSETAKPPLFTDTPTRVAPAPMQDALLGKDNGQRARRGDEASSDSHTPLPKPMPFHSDADEFPDEAFEEATKVRALDELIAQTAGGGTAQDELAARRSNGRTDSPAADPMGERPTPRPDAARPAPEAREAPNLPNPPEPSLRPQAKLLDTSPSPRIEPGQPPPLPEAIARARLGAEPGRGRITTPPVGAMGPLAGSMGPAMGPTGPTMGHPMASAMSPSAIDPFGPSGMRSIAHEQTEPARMLPAARSGSRAPLLILLMVLVAAGGAAVWFFVLRPQAAEPRDHAAVAPPEGAGATPGSAVVAAGSADSAAAAGSAVPAATPDPAGSNAARAELVDTVIGSSVDGATVEITGTDQSGPAPFTAKLEKGKPYKARIAARGFAALELDLVGGSEKHTANLVAKPRFIKISSDPPGAVIIVDSGLTGHTTPSEVELTAAQAAKRAIRVQLRKTGYRTLDRVIDLSKYTEDDARMVAKIDERLAVQTQAASHAGSGAGSAKGSAGTEAGSGSASDATPAPAGGSAQDPAAGSAAPAPAPAGATGPGSAAEPEPDFNKPK